MSAGDIAVGAHCSLERCNVNDFLPIKCRCDQLFCKEHISPEIHSCRLLETPSTSSSTAQFAQRLDRCAADKCNKPSLEAFVANSSDTQGRTPALCPQCHQAFCASHREPTSHGCVAKPGDTQPVKNEAARAMLAKMFPSKPAESGSGSPAAAVPAKRKAPPTDPKKAAQLRKVELMKMRHKAQPGDPKDKNRAVAIDQKLHVKVKAEEKGDEEKVFWFQKTIIVGRALDLLASQFSISSDSAPLYLEKVTPEEERVRLQNDKLLADQVEDGILLILSR